MSISSHIIIRASNLACSKIGLILIVLFCLIGSFYTFDHDRSLKVFLKKLELPFQTRKTPTVQTTDRYFEFEDSQIRKKLK